MFSKPNDIAAREEAYKLIHMITLFKKYVDHRIDQEQYAAQQLSEMELQ